MTICWVRTLSADLEKEFSNEKQVTKETPRAFIVYSDDDKVVPPANGVNYYLALNKKGVPSVLHIYPTADTVGEFVKISSTRVKCRTN